MALDRTKLHRVGPQNSNAPTLWTYATSDALTAVDAAGYFNGAADILQVGDWIHVSSTSTYGVHIVNANTYDPAGGVGPDAAVVDVTNAISFGTIDSD